MEKGTDPLTGEVFIKKRSNQVFASRENQIRYNNRKAGHKRKVKSRVDRKLDKNREILKSVLGDQKEVTKSKDFLLGAGFHFGCQTHSIRKGDITWQCVYEFAYAGDSSNSYKIIRHE